MGRGYRKNCSWRATRVACCFSAAPASRARKQACRIFLASQNLSCWPPAPAAPDGARPASPVASLAPSAASAGAVPAPLAPRPRHAPGRAAPAHASALPDPRRLPPEPLIAGLPADPVLTAQHRHLILARQNPSDKLHSLVHVTGRFPRHRQVPPAGSSDLSPIHPVNFVTNLPGPYTSLTLPRLRGRVGWGKRSARDRPAPAGQCS